MTRLPLSTSEIIAALLLYYKQNDRQFEADCGLANAALNKSRKRESFTADIAKKIIARHPELEYGWLMDGVGDMMKSEEVMVRIAFALERIATALENGNRHDTD